MRAFFVDANEALASLATRLMIAQGPPITVNHQPDIGSEAIPAAIDGFEIAIIDHTPLPTDVARRCPSLRHVVFLGTGARPAHRRRRRNE